MRVRREHLGADTMAGLVLGLQSVPDGLATGLLTGVSPLAGLNAYMVGTLAGALATSSTFMAIQGTGRDGDDHRRHPGRAGRAPGTSGS